MLVFGTMNFSTFTKKSVKHILIIDDEEKLRGLLARIIRAEGFEVSEAADLQSGFKKLQTLDIDVVLCDVKLPDGSGVAFVPKVKTAFPMVEIALLTAFGNIPDGVQAMRDGAFDYIVKGDDNDKIIPILYKAIDKVQLQKKVGQLEQRISEKFGFEAVVGTSKPLAQAIALARKVAPGDATVLLTGETGTGKEVFAQAIHENSGRKHNSFVALNCSAFSREILESELFGYKAGAFTGAAKDKKGFLDEADGGTLFLDEIGEMPLELQAKMLRVLETNEYIPVGDTRVRKSNFRLIAATNRDLKQESEQQRFRADLYFRLNVFEIQLLPLRQRQKDIEPLARLFAVKASVKVAKPGLELSPETIEKLEAYDWPGNIRELKNVVERAAILCDGLVISADDLPLEIQHPAPRTSGAMSAFSLESVEKLHLQKVLNYTNGNKAEAARLLEIGIATLYRKIDAYQL